MFTRWFHNLSKNAALLLALTPLCLLRASSMPSVLGYDYGFYRYAALHPSLSLNAIFTGVQGGYANILFPLLHALHVPVDVGLIACLYLAAIALGATLCYILLPYSKTAAICGVLLLACSTIQSETYNMFLWKTVLALPLLLMGLLGLEKKKYILLGGALLALILTHRTTLIVLLLAVGLHIFIRLITTRRWHYVLYVGLGLGLLALTLGDSLGAWWHIVFSSANGDVVAGIFFHNQNVLVALLPISLLALYGLSTMVKQKSTPATLLLFVGISLGWIFLRLPFYHRFYIYLDLGLLLLGAI
ncbi:MAG: hypothetical protein JNK33_05310, partial [Candidatus Doudnabacteria bacterium]|nr:hypothetical protein [Candidatus Doudnabacteria bacterium]